jgi:hypothetical protein
MLFAVHQPQHDRREDDSFRKFWDCYPRKTGKLAAQKAYHVALKTAGEQEILDGVERYKRTKPGYADWCHPKTFLSQGRWMDEPDTPQATKHPWDVPIEQHAVTTSWMDDCQRLHQGECKGSLGVHRRRMEHD